MSKLNSLWIENRLALIAEAEDDLEKLMAGDHSVIKKRGCDVDHYTEEQRLANTEQICRNVIKNVTEYLEKFDAN